MSLADGPADDEVEGWTRRRDQMSIFARYLSDWNLVPDGAPIVTRSSRLLPVRDGGESAMLKVALAAEERAGAALMAWWAGEGAARVLRQDDDAILLERACGARSLADLARSGHDEEATRLICAAVSALHAARPDPPATLVPLARWFRDLWPAAERHSGLLASSAAARELLEAPQDVTVLHGDIHHGNILDFGARGWLAIDPKGLIGERGFDYANLFCNPDPSTATSPAIFARRLEVVVTEARLDRRRLLQWVLAWAGLSAAWDLADGAACEHTLAVAELAAAELRS